MKNINKIILSFLVANQISDSITKDAKAKSNTEIPQNIAINIHNHLNSKHQSTTSTAQETKQNLKTMADNLKKNLKENLNTLDSWIQNHKLLIGISAISIIYLGTLYKVAKLHNAIKDQDCWSCWKQGITLEKLLAIPQKELTEELISDINFKNYNQKNPTNFVDPLIVFISQTDKELQNLKDFISSATIVKNLNLARIYFINESEILQAQERVKRLTYFKNLFSTWMSDYRKQHLFNLKTTEMAAKAA